MTHFERYQSEDASAAQLAEPLHFEFSGRTTKNRFLKAAMSELLSSWSPTDLRARGIPTTNLINVYRRWGEGGYGQIVTGNIMIEYEQLVGAGNAIIPLNACFEGERFEAFKRLAEVGKKEGSLIVGQVCHPGRQVGSKIQKNPISASDVQLKGQAYGMTFEKPRPASQDDINRIIECFAHAAEFLYNAGFDGIQLHGAHGFLLAQFLSSTTNKRTDEYGGSLQNRMRLILEIAEAVHERVPSSFVLGIKINSVEFQEGGFTPDEAQQLCRALEDSRFDYVELSGGTYEESAFAHKRESTKKRECFFLDFAREIVPGLTKTRSYVTGGFNTLGAMVKALDTVDGVGLARPVCQEFHLPADLLEGKVKGAIKQGLDPQNFGLTYLAAGSQICRVGKDKEPIDFSRKENVNQFMKDLEAWQKKMAEDKEGKEYGYIDVSADCCE